MLKSILPAALLLIFSIGGSNAQVKLGEPRAIYMENYPGFRVSWMNDHYDVVRVGRNDSTVYELDEKYRGQGAFSSYWKNGHLKMKTGLRGDLDAYLCQVSLQFGFGAFEGPTEIYYENGKPDKVCTYSCGRYDGRVLKYFEEGGIKADWNYQKGRAHGIAINYHPNGQQSAERHFEFGNQQTYKKEWWPNGQLKFFTSQNPTFRKQEFREDGRRTRFYVEDSIDYYLNHDGSQQEKAFDSLKGNWLLKRTWPNGNLRFEERFEAFHGMPLGERRFYLEDGSLDRVETYEVQHTDGEIEFDEETEIEDIPANFWASEMRPDIGWRGLQKRVNFDIREDEIKKKDTGTYILLISRHHEEVSASFEGDGKFQKSEIAAKIINSLLSTKWYPMVLDRNAIDRVVLRLEIEVSQMPKEK